MKFTLDAYSIWEYGQRKDAEGKPHQEDSLFPSHGMATGDDRLFLVCDGMGGHDSGEVASATVVKAMSDYILSHCPDPQGPFTDEILQGAIAAAYDALDAADTGGAKKMGTTMTLLKLHEDGATIAHIGDSRVYHVRPGRDGSDTEILFETSDHSLVNDLIKVGELTAEEARHSRQKNVITRAMQPAQPHRCAADIKHISDIKAGDYFYLCSDGMLENMEDDNIRFNFSALTGGDPQKVQILRDSTRHNADNHTAYIVHITSVTGAPVRPMPQDVPAPKPKVVTVTPPVMPRSQAGIAGSNPKPMAKLPVDKWSKMKFQVFAVIGVLVCLIVGLVFYIFKGDSADKQPKKIEVVAPANDSYDAENASGVVSRPSRSDYEESAEERDRHRRENMKPQIPDGARDYIKNESEAPQNNSSRKPEVSKPNEQPAPGNDTKPAPSQPSVPASNETPTHADNPTTTTNPD